MNMEPSIKDKYIILGFIFVAICMISFFITIIIAASFNQDNFVRLIVFVCSNLLGWLLYLSFQTVIFDTYEIYRIKFGKKDSPSEIISVQAEPSSKTQESVTPAQGLQKLPLPRNFMKRTAPAMRTNRNRKKNSVSGWLWNTSTSSCPVLPMKRL